MDDRVSSKQACNPVEKVNRLLDELVATADSTQVKTSDRRREHHASLKSLTHS
ncbi:MAG: hypothetical protein ACFB0C_21450 [Leptolyngbyaceae cyanobacterium]